MDDNSRNDFPLPGAGPPALCKIPGTQGKREWPNVYSVAVDLFAVPGIDAATHGNGVRPVASPTKNYLPQVAVRRILIVGAGGFGREVLHWARAAWPDHAPLIAGFLSADRGILSQNDCPLPVLADPAEFEPKLGDALVLAIGIPGVRRRVSEDLLARGAEFLTLVHPSAIVCASATLGSGSVICPGAIVSDSAKLGRFCLLNYHASLAHDSSAGDFAVLSPYAALAGGAHVAADVFLGLHASVGPGVSVGRNSKIAANSCALTDAPADVLVVGVPGRISPLLA